MTTDKQSSGYLAKHATPTLSAAFHRSNKSPLTPKLASANGYHSSTKRFATTDPLRDDHSHPVAASTVAANGATYLNANITPRSGPRNTRRDGVRTSPASTPSSAHHSPQTSFSQLPGPAAASKHSAFRVDRSPVRSIGKSESSRILRAKTHATDHSQNSPHTRPKSVHDPSAAAPMFFHASDAKSTISSDQESVRSKPQTKTPPVSTFVYANGEEERKLSVEEQPRKRASSGLSRPVSFAVSPAAISSLSKSPKVSQSTEQLSADIRAVPSQPPDGTSEAGSFPQGSLLNNWQDKKPPTPVVRHMKSTSLDSTQHRSPPREILRPGPLLISPSTVPEDGISANSSPGPRPRILSNGSGVSVSSCPGSPPPIVTGMVRTEGIRPPANDTALNARTERKILDLEISNSSLLAINRTLEREMRKQNAELRRYRRLSRSGRLSMAPSTRSFSGPSLSVTSEADGEASEESSNGSEDEASDYSDEESVADDGVLSPGSLAEHDARHRAHDEQRVWMDLSKHQELLIDSQKLNQSLKRCLGWTEELIKEGQKALDYHVHVNDVELGGRVLAPEELSDVAEGARGLLSPSLEVPSPLPPSVDVEPSP